MRQRPALLACGFFWIAAFCAIPAGCERAAGPHAAPSAKTAPTVVSLVPAATDLIAGMGAADHLVGISTWDSDRAETAGLPRIGDYRTIDWEKLILADPDVMIVQFAPTKIPAGLRDEADALDIQLVNVRINRLDDLFMTLDQLGDALSEQTKSAEAQRTLRARLDAVRNRIAGAPAVATLITRAEPSHALACVGGGNYLDELLTIAGGKNVLGGGENSYPTIDQERVLDLQPQVVLALLPGASPQVIEQTRSFWQNMPEVPAVRDGRVYILTEPFLLLPGLSAGHVAEIFADRLHPPTTQPGAQ